MTCAESLERMSELLDGVPSDALEGHLGGCPSCREGLESMRRADLALRGLPALAWRPEMTESILRRAKRPRRVLPAIAAAGIAALLLLSLIPSDSRPTDLLAVGLCQFEDGDPAGGIRTLEGLLDRHPDSPFADGACLALAGHFAKEGDDLSALAFYASIRRPESVTPDVHRAIRESGRRAGQVFVGARPLEQAEMADLRRSAESRSPYGLVRAAPDGRREILLLGPVGPEAAPFACASAAVRATRIDPARPPDAPGVREMLRAIEGAAK